MNFYKHYIGDYQRDTAHLSITEHGAYRLMLDTYYATGKPLPVERKALCRLLRADGASDKAAIDGIVCQFWKETPDGLINTRARLEIEKAQHQAAINKQVGKRGGRPRLTEQITESVIHSDNESVSETEPNRNPNHSHKELKQKQTLVQPVGFTEFWQVYPRKEAKKTAMEAWRRLGHVNGLLPTIIGAVDRCKRSESWTKGGGQFIPLPATWINGHRWEDEGTTAPSLTSAPGWAS